MNGCNGKMGQMITKLAGEASDIKIVAGVDRNADRFSNPYPVYDSLYKVEEKVDVIVDFSHPSSLPDLIKYSMNSNTALVIATTGLSDNDRDLILHASNSIPVFHSANMSIGINVIMNMLSDISKALYKDFDIEIIEKHHNEKKDAPSGTALMLANEIKNSLPDSIKYVYDRSGLREKRSKNEIGIHSLRGGSIPGEHSIVFAGIDEIIEIKHTALSRSIFAKGTIEAIRFIYDKQNGLYSMKNMLEEMN
jgi:4-hydroxy-tetrahydrodipicolinate reductase